VQALLALGWPHHALGAAGIVNSAQIIGASGDLITVQRWRQVRDVYDRLSMTPGPSPETRGWAAKRVQRVRGGRVDPVHLRSDPRR